MRAVGRALFVLLAASSRLGPACAGCRVVPVDRAGATCSPACWSARHR
ncbi:hypothetical protein [Nocardioides perillae]|uniref:Uncharacterized protein n=1 Tax=Nocardioides perillae TaxID=1119534 RepID=A0A7Y9RVE5_9ACTN|nr:hypothetical protein [Nocardioides perillae]